MSQTEQQLRLTIEALREKQEDELINNTDFGLLHNVAAQQRLHTRTGPPTPDDMDALLARRRKTRFYLAHPYTRRKPPPGSNWPRSITEARRCPTPPRPAPRI